MKYKIINKIPVLQDYEILAIFSVQMKVRNSFYVGLRGRSVPERQRGNNYSGAFPRKGRFDLLCKSKLLQHRCSRERPDSQNKDEKVSPGSSVSCVWNLTWILRLPLRHTRARIAAQQSLLCCIACNHALKWMHGS